MPNLEILCVTMHQKDFSKIKEMNINCDVVFANQADDNRYDECEFDRYKAKMITTSTRGVGINRNLALSYASAEYCILADDDVVYDDDMKERVLSEFENHPEADVMIFHLSSDSKERTLEKYSKTKRWPVYKGLPFGGVRIAFRLGSVKKANVWFTTLFGGGAIFPSGEDSLFLTGLRKAGLKFYVSKETIGKVSFDTSSWFTGYNEKYYYGKGAFYQAIRPKMKYFWMLYILLRTYKRGDKKLVDRLRWMYYGSVGYKKLLSYDEFERQIKSKC